MNIVSITKKVKGNLIEEVLTQYPYLAQNANGLSYLYKSKPTLDHRGYWVGETYGTEPIMEEPYSNDWEQSILYFDAEKELVALGEGAFFVLATDDKSEAFKKAFTSTSIDLHGVFTHVA